MSGLFIFCCIVAGVLGYLCGVWCFGRPSKWNDDTEADPSCRCGHPRSRHGLMGHPDCTDGEGDFFCLCESFRERAK